MKQILFTINTPYGATYKVNEAGEISNNNLEFSGNWKIQGIEHVRGGRFIPFAEMTQENIKSLSLLYKNGNPQWTVRDLDHGTTRTWGNTQYHGIKSISFQ